MTPQESLLVAFRLIDDTTKTLHLGRPRRRGRAPELADSAVIAIGIVGESRGRDADRDLFRREIPGHTVPPE